MLSVKNLIVVPLLFYFVYFRHSQSRVKFLYDKISRKHNTYGSRFDLFTEQCSIFAEYRYVHSFWKLNPAISRTTCRTRPFVRVMLLNTFLKLIHFMYENLLRMSVICVKSPCNTTMELLSTRHGLMEYCNWDKK